jgi:hypothetical protein
MPTRAEATVLPFSCGRCGPIPERVRSIRDRHSGSGISTAYRIASVHECVHRRGVVARDQEVQGLPGAGPEAPVDLVRQRF